eukprot:8537324-Karenia_brevis.AAC.1
MRVRQLQKAHPYTLPDLPAHADPTTRNSTLLAKVGRSTSKEIYDKNSACRIIMPVSMDNGAKVHVMPRSLLRPVTHELPESNEVIREAMPDDQLQTTPE